jgi:hypothetical protein
VNSKYGFLLVVGDKTPTTARGWCHGFLLVVGDKTPTTARGWCHGLLPVVGDKTPTTARPGFKIDYYRLLVTKHQQRLSVCDKLQQNG